MRNYVRCKAVYGSDDISEALAREAGQKLDGCSVFIVGEDERGAREIGKMIADALGYTPLHTIDVLEQSKGMSIAQIEEAEGASALVLGEAEVLEVAATFVRCVITTWGSGIGAAARGDLGWRYLYGGVTCFLDTESARSVDPGDDSQPARRAYELAEVHVCSPGISASGTNGPVVAEEILRYIIFFIDNNPDVIKKKSLYGAPASFNSCQCTPNLGRACRVFASHLTAVRMFIRSSLGLPR